MAKLLTLRLLRPRKRRGCDLFSYRMALAVPIDRLARALGIPVEEIRQRESGMKHVPSAIWLTHIKTIRRLTLYGSKFSILLRD